MLAVSPGPQECRTRSLEMEVSLVHADLSLPSGLGHSCLQLMHAAPAQQRLRACLQGRPPSATLLPHLPQVPGQEVSPLCVSFYSAASGACLIGSCALIN